MFGKKYDIHTELDGAVIDLLTSIEGKIAENELSGNARENCIIWKIKALQELEDSPWDHFFTAVNSCHLPSGSTPHHWIELTLKSQPGTIFVWDGTRQFMKNSSLNNITNASAEWRGYSDDAVERLQVIPEYFD